MIISIEDSPLTPEVTERKMAPDDASPRGLNMPMPDPGPNRLWYLVAVFLFFGGITAGVLITARTVVTDEGFRVVIPGEERIEIVEPGNYVLWHEYRGVKDGEGFQVDAKLPDWQLALAPLEDAGSPLAVQRTPHARENIRGSIRTTLGRYDLEPGTYVLSVQGDFPERVLLLRRSQAARYGLGMALGFGVSLLGGIGGPALALSVYYRRRSNFRRLYSPMATSTPGPETGVGSS